MRILLNARAFYPMVGGLEVVSQQLAEAWAERGHEVRVWTQAPIRQAAELPGLAVFREPSRREASRLVSWSDVVVYSGITLRDLLLAFVPHRRPVVFIHHGMMEYREGFSKRLVKLKRIASRLGTNVAVSQAVARTVPGGAHVIPNAFRPAFEDLQRAPETLLFVGRLVSEKGVDVALHALALLHERGYALPLLVCGDGPERPNLEALASRLGLASAVTFAGWTPPEHLGEHYSRASAVVVPSRQETFGITALEAIAAGAPVVASDVGGLSEAVGACGVLVPSDRPDALATGILDSLSPVRQAEFRAAAPAHLDRHRIGRVADDYLAVLDRVVRSS